MSQNTPSEDLPVVIIGAGLAGLTVALHLAQQGREVIVLAKRNLEESATAWAQGGIVGVLGDDDSVESHVRDTQDAGAGLVDEETARFIAAHSAAAIEWLVEQGVPFSPDPEGPLGLHLTREGGHAVRRIAHAADATGKAIHDVLLDEVREGLSHSRFASLILFMAATDASSLEGRYALFYKARAELREELGIAVQTAYPWLTRVFTYPHATVRLHFFRVTGWVGTLHGRENQQFVWQRLPEVTVSPLLPANAPVLRALALPPVYAISHASELGEAVFLQRVEAALRTMTGIDEISSEITPNPGRIMIYTAGCE